MGKRFEFSFIPASLQFTSTSQERRKFSTINIRTEQIFIVHVSPVKVRMTIGIRIKKHPPTTQIKSNQQQLMLHHTSPEETLFTFNSIRDGWDSRVYSQISLKAS
jgi:hypothetical protein